MCVLFANIMSFEHLIYTTLFLVGLSIVLIPIIKTTYKSVASFVLVFLNAVITTIPAVGALTGREVHFIIQTGNTFGTIQFAIDPLSAWFILIINLTLINGSLYGIGYMKSYENRNHDLSLHWVMFVLFHASMLWVCMLRNGLAFLIAWEIMTISSLILVLFDHAKTNTLKAGINYLVQMHLGVAFLTVAFIWVFATGNSMSFEGIANYLQNHKAYWMLLLFFLGFGIKAGFVPLHTWLPHAHPAAPSHISGIMSGVIVKMGIYGILRIAVSIRHDLVTIGNILLIISAVTVLYAILNASVHRDFKKMLAFCTSENIGIVGMGIGLILVGRGTGNPVISILGYAAALLHTLNHSLYKSLLFFASGNVYQQVHTRNMESLGGLIRYMPQTAVTFLIGALAIGGLPPFNGFVSKFLVYSGFIETFKTQDVMLSALMIGCIIIISMAGGVSLLSFTKAFGTIFLGVPRTNYSRKPAEVSWIMRLPLFAIILIMMLIGLFPSLILKPVISVIRSLEMSLDLQPLNSINHAMELIGRASVLLITVTGILYFIRKKLSVENQIREAPTWGCGYVAPQPDMQYTGKSFSKSLAKLFGFITIEDKKYRELQAESIFPSKRSYASSYLEFFETRVFEPLINLLLRFINAFTFIHNGKIQLYVLYGLFFIVVLIILSFINIL